MRKEAVISWIFCLQGAFMLFQALMLVAGNEQMKTEVSTFLGTAGLMTLGMGCLLMKTSVTARAKSLRKGNERG